MSRRWQVYSCTCCDVISLTAWTELSLHIIAAVLRLNVSIPRGLLRGTSFFRKPRCKRDLQRLDRSSSVESHTGGLFCRGNKLSRSEEHTSELQSLAYLVCRLLLEKKKQRQSTAYVQIQKHLLPRATSQDGAARNPHH